MPKEHTPNAYQQQIHGGSLRLPGAWSCRLLAAAMDKEFSERELAVCIAALVAIEGAKKPVVKLGELSHLVGGGGERLSPEALRRCLRRLCVLGVLQVEKLTFNEPEPLQAAYRVTRGKLEGLTSTERARQMYGELARGRKQCFVVGLRALRWALRQGSCGVRSRVAVLMALSHRCLFLQSDSTFTARGRSKAKDLANWLGISKRTVDAKRRELEQVGIIRKLSVPVWNLKQWGENYEFDLTWAGTDRERKASAFATQNASVGGPVCNANKNQSLSLRERTTNQSQAEPAVGFYRTKQGRRFPKLGAWNLANFEKRMKLFDELAKLGWVQDTALKRAEFEGSYQDACSQGRNAASVLAWRVQQQKLGFCTSASESSVYERVKQYLAPVVRSVASAVRKKVLSKDGFAVRALLTHIQTGAIMARVQEIPKLLSQQGGWSLERATVAVNDFELWSGQVLVPN